MPAFAWSPEYATGEAAIDAQHREWFRRVRALVAVQGAGALDAARATDLLDLAATYTTRHFELEEFMLRLARYPGLQEHAAAHRALALQVAALLQAARGGARSAPAEAGRLLVSWIPRQIKTADLAYVPWVRRQREEAAEARVEALRRTCCDVRAGSAGFVPAPAPAPRAQA